MSEWIEVQNGRYRVKDGRLQIDLVAPNPQVLPYFSSYDPDRPTPETVFDYSRADNVTGHVQRAFLNYWAIRGFIESGGYPGVDMCGAGVLTPACISLDNVGTGEVSKYGGGAYAGVHVKGDASQLENYGTDTFSCVVSSHGLEHTPLCTEIPDALQNDPYYKIQRACPGKEMIPVLREWVRIVRPGGYVACCLPDDMAAQRTGSSVFFEDRTHQHAPDSRTFRQLILEPLADVAEVILYDTYGTNFSFCWVLRKK